MSQTVLVTGRTKIDGELYEASLDFVCPDDVAGNKLAYKSWLIERQNEVRRKVKSKISGTPERAGRSVNATSVEL